ncbi:hypothetical protein DUNSADRAFT_18732 [Dunaliella salina]|uniref:Centrosomal protein POC5 n=1 Tax=Dunaliella salina TaxID=3046 RepID=A0ABQ7GYQ8_DUNSA|nr:hypothetical protein DUNSADRAFT_18732 [Dunaliella salina]|eukprot:KAF5839732.1 hypothetical protein DUNSADRAFT_18732 [Dunaliella salina]
MMSTRRKLSFRKKIKMDQPNPFAPPCYPQVQRYTDTSRLNDQGEGNDDAMEPSMEGEDLAPPHIPSALAGLTIQQMCDLDVEQMAVKIDKHHCQTKKSILDNMLEVKAKMLAAQSQAVAEERRSNGAMISAKQAEIDLLRFELNQMTGRANKVTEVSRRLAAAFDFSKHRRRQTGLFTQAFYCWRQFAILARQRKMRMARAQDWYQEVHLKRHVLRAWFRTAMQDHRVTVNVRAAQAVEQAKQGLAGQFVGHVEELRRQLHTAHGQLEQEQEARAKLEENMKQAFMRGVCALNIEAVGIMKRSGQHPQQPQQQPPAPSQGSNPNPGYDPMPPPPPNPMPPPPYMPPPPAAWSAPPLPPGLLPTTVQPPPGANTPSSRGAPHIASVAPSTPAAAAARAAAVTAAPPTSSSPSGGPSPPALSPSSIPPAPSSIPQARHFHRTDPSSSAPSPPPSSTYRAGHFHHTPASLPLPSHSHSFAAAHGSPPVVLSPPLPQQHQQYTAAHRPLSGAQSASLSPTAVSAPMTAVLSSPAAAQAAVGGGGGEAAGSNGGGVVPHTSGTALNYYRPKVLVERGPGVGSPSSGSTAVSAAEPPRPRPPIPVQPSMR